MDPALVKYASTLTFTLTLQLTEWLAHESNGAY